MQKAFYDPDLDHSSCLKPFPQQTADPVNVNHQCERVHLVQLNPTKQLRSRLGLRAGSGLILLRVKAQVLG